MSDGRGQHKHLHKSPDIIKHSSHERLCCNTEKEHLRLHFQSFHLPMPMVNPSSLFWTALMLMYFINEFNEEFPFCLAFFSAISRSGIFPNYNE